VPLLFCLPRSVASGRRFISDFACFLGPVYLPIAPTLSCAVGIVAVAEGDVHVIGELVHCMRVFAAAGSSADGDGDGDGAGGGGGAAAAVGSADALARRGRWAWSGTPKAMEKVIVHSSR
jgi:hypothetical protein